MSRKMLITLIVLMAFVLSGLIFVQTSMIKKASDIREEQFNQLVTNALLLVMARLNQYEVVEARAAALQNQLPRLSNSVNDFNKFPRDGNGRSKMKFGFSLSENGVTRTFQEEVQISNLDVINNQKGSDNEVHSDSLGIAGVQKFREIAEQRRQQFVKDMNWYENYKVYLEERPIQERINPEFLSQALTNAIAEAGINLEYKFAIKNSNLGQNKIIFGDQDYVQGRKKEFSQPLFKNDLNGAKPNYLYIYFPQRSRYLLRETGYTIIPTIILTAFLIGIFVYTLMVILRQKKLSNIKNDFINNMTHELKTPISTISLASQMLQDGSISNTPTMIEHVSKVIYEESKRLGFQVEKVLQMAVFNEGKLKFKLKEFDVNKMINTVINNFELRVKNKNGTLTTDISEESLIVKGDEVHITNVIFNLLDNAVKYSKEAPEIEVATKMQNGNVVISIRDNGIGIPKEYQAQIFDRFYRVPTGNVHDVKGFGLGLSYVKKIIDSHDGKIKVESALNKGTKFSILFPQIKN